MPLTPEDVSNKRFTPVRLREGYDMGEVDQFLDEVEAELARLTKENEDLRSKVSAAQGSSETTEQAPEAPKPEQAAAAPAAAAATAPAETIKVETVPQASKAAARGMTEPASPTGSTQPKTMSSTSPVSRPFLSRTAASTLGQNDALRSC